MFRGFLLVLDTTTGLAWKSKEALDHIYIYSIYLLWAKEGYAFFLSIAPST